MRLYYIFSIKESIYRQTKSDPNKLYHILESIYKLNKKEIKLAYKVFEKTCNFINKKNVNLLVRNLNYDNDNYTCYRETHIINDFYKNESTKLIIKNSHMLINTNVIYPKFFNEIKNLNNIFVCDFVNEDYFYLKKINLKEYNYS